MSDRFAIYSAARASSSVLILPTGCHFEVPGYEGRYYINVRGQVWSTMKGGRIVKPGITLGYHRVGLSSPKGKRTHYLLHRLVARMFIPNPLGLPEVNHINGRKGHNGVSNLEWVTSAENSRHAVTSGLQFGRKGEDCYAHKLTQQQAAAIRNALAGGARGRDLARQYAVSECTISEIKTGKRWADTGQKGGIYA